jgi:hypothetical protein
VVALLHRQGPARTEIVLQVHYYQSICRLNLDDLTSKLLDFTPPLSIVAILRIAVTIRLDRSLLSTCRQ